MTSVSRSARPEPVIELGDTYPELRAGVRAVCERFPGDYWRYLDERLLIASECIGDARWFLEKASAWARERVVFARPIGQNQGIQFPLAHAYASMTAAGLVARKGCARFEAGEQPGEEANMALMLASEASWEAGNAAIQTFGGRGFDAEYDVERKLRETRLYQVAPISKNLILSYLAVHVLGLPRSF